MTKSSLSVKTLPPELSSIPSVVRDEPQIYPGRSEDVEETEGTSTLTEERGAILITNIWKHEADYVLDVVSRSLMHHPTFIRNRKPSFFQEREKKKKYLQACLDQRRHFSLFVVSCDGLVGNETKVALAGSLDT